MDKLASLALSAVLDGDVGEAVPVVVGDSVVLVVEGDGVAAGVGPDDTDGGGAAFEAVVEVEFGQGEVLLVVGVDVVGGEDALAVAEEGQAVAGEEGLYGSTVLVTLVGQDCLGVSAQLAQ